VTKLGIGLRTAILALATALAASLAPTVAQAQGRGHGGHDNSGHGSPAVLALPNGFRPEGIAIKDRTAYFGSLADGDIYAVNLRNGKGRVIRQGQGTPSVGLKIDKHDRLFVAGGPAGDARVVDVRSGEILKSYQLTTGAGFINDVTLFRGTAWFTDSANPVLYGVPLGRHGALPDASAVIRLPLTGDYVHQAGFNLNGITGTPDGRALLAVQTSTGLLFRIDPRTGATRKVDLGGYALTNGDGLLTAGRTLYVVQNRLNKVAVLTLNHRGTAGALRKTLVNPNLDVPTTVAKSGKWLYLPNARFSTPPTPETTYTAVRVRR